MNGCRHIKFWFVFQVLEDPIVVAFASLCNQEVAHEAALMPHPSKPPERTSRNSSDATNGRTTTRGPQAFLRRPGEIRSQVYDSLMLSNACSQCPASFRSDILRRVCGEVSTVWWQPSRLWKEIITRLFRLKGRRVHFIRGDLSFGCLYNRGHRYHLHRVLNRHITWRSSDTSTMCRAMTQYSGALCVSNVID